MARRRWRGVPKAERSKITRAAGRLGGRPKILRTCGICGAIGGTVEMRGHKCASAKQLENTAMHA
jgi:hypothetical protein